MKNEYDKTDDLLQAIETFPIEGMDPAFLDAPFSQFNALSIIQTNTNPDWIKSRKSGKMDLQYVSGDTVTRLLNKAFRYKWSFYVLETRVVESQDKINKWKPEVAPEPQLPVVQVHGRLVVPGWGVREQWGAQPLSGGSDVQEHAFKSAATDAMKKCASMFGIALDLYGTDGMDGLAVTAKDYLTDDEVVIKNYKEHLRKQREEQLKATQPSVPHSNEPVSQQIQPQTAQEMTPKEREVVPTESVQATPIVPPVKSPEVISQPAEPEAAPQAPSQPSQTQANYWQEEDIEGLRNAKAALGIDPANNDALDKYTQEFFGMPEATYRNISPSNVKDFLHFLSSKY